MVYRLTYGLSTVGYIPGYVQAN